MSQKQAAAANVPVVQPKKKKPFSISDITPYFYILPSLLLFCTFVFYPFFRTIYLSFHLTDATGNVVKYYGISNYVKVITSSKFSTVMGVTWRFALTCVVGTLFISIICALLANINYRGRAFARTCFALPMAVSSACIAVIVSFALHPTCGVINNLLGTNIKFTQDKDIALWTVSAVSIWMHIGMNYIFLIAALQGVDTSLYEAADIEGVNFFQKHWHVTFPSISPTLFYLMVVNVTQSFQAYAQINLLTGGGPGNSTRVIVYNIYEEAFRYGKYGSAAAQSVILFAMIFIITRIEFYVEKKVTY